MPKRRTKCEACQVYGCDNMLVPSTSGRLIQLCTGCLHRADEVAARITVAKRERKQVRRQRTAPVYRVECGDLNETVTGAFNHRDAAMRALEQSDATELGSLLRVRLVGRGYQSAEKAWHYLDPMSLADAAARPAGGH